jgi:hypothetical protein
MTPDEFRAAFALSKGFVHFTHDEQPKKAKVGSVIRGENADGKDTLIIMARCEDNKAWMLYTSEITAVT